jgi:threonine aldolase
MNKIMLLKQVVDMLNEANYIQQMVYGDSDVGQDNHQRIEELIEDIEVDICEMESK